MITFGNLGTRVRDGGGHRRDLELRRRAQGAAHRAVRHLPGLRMATTAIQATGINKWFGEGAARTHAVKDVSFEAAFGEMLYIVGPSGSGKTTLLSMISGILRPNSGNVRSRGRGHLEPVERCSGRLPAAPHRFRVPGLPPVPAPDHRGERGDPAHPAASRLGRRRRGGRAHTSRSSASRTARSCRR